MTKIKLCGLKRECDIEWANEIKPDYVGFVCAKSSRRYVEPKETVILKSLLSPFIQAVGVFVNAEIEVIAAIAFCDVKPKHIAIVKISKNFFIINYVLFSF